jgi:hypothetical protein
VKNVLGQKNRAEMKLEEANPMLKPTSPKKVIFTVEPRTTEEKIRARAYELFGARKREDGHDLEDWFRAEEEITSRNTGSAAA